MIETKGYGIRGISACLPNNVQNLEEIYKDNLLLLKSIGVKKKRATIRGVSFSTYSKVAINTLLRELRWEASDVGCLIVVTQTPDYIIPAVSHYLQYACGIPENAFVCDIRNGCSGFVYGLFLTITVMKSIDAKRGILVCGDLPTLACNPMDSATALFGDAVCAIAIEKNDQDHQLFSFFSDGSNYDAIIITDGGSARPLSQSSLSLQNGKRRSIDINLDGLKVFKFSVIKVVNSIREFFYKTGIDSTNIDYFFFHQASKIINDAMIKTLGLPFDKCPETLSKYGNTSSASIPLTIVDYFTEYPEKLNSTLRVFACGFGVGLSWAHAIFYLSPNLKIIPPVFI